MGYNCRKPFDFQVGIILRHVVSQHAAQSEHFSPPAVRRRPDGVERVILKLEGVVASQTNLELPDMFRDRKVDIDERAGMIAGRRIGR